MNNLDTTDFADKSFNSTNGFSPVTKAARLPLTNIANSSFNDGGIFGQAFSIDSSQKPSEIPTIKRAPFPPTFLKTDTFIKNKDFINNRQKRL